jgi:TrmH family RNA methyltransferase
VQLLFSTDPSFVEEYQGVQVTARGMESMSSLSTASDYLVVLEQPEESWQPPTEGLVLALDGVSDPGNMGTIVRTAEWFGVSQLLLSENCVEMFNPKTVQSTMGSLFRIPFAVGQFEIRLQELKKNGYTLLGAHMEGESLYDHSFQPKTAFVMGSESHGISKDVQQLLHSHITIPCFGKAESLNVSMASGILLSEFRRQCH